MQENLTIEQLIKQALEEDIGKGDITTSAIVPEEKEIEADIIFKSSDGLICGLPFVELLFNLLDKNIFIQFRVNEGQHIKKGDIIVHLQGKARLILAGERTALNILQHLSGIATLTNKFVEAVKPYSVKIMDTRKTLPNLRYLEKYAVRIGGGHNHRFGLYDAILIKDNHIKIVGSIKEAVQRVRNKYGNDVFIEVETKNLKEVEEALSSNVNVIMLDNMDIENLRNAVAIINKKALVEVSGNVTLENVQQIASIGVDMISIGALTHSAPALDFSLKVV